MPTLDWDKWASAWSAVFPKNQMWGKIRSGENDPETGEPLYRWDDKPNTEATDPALADVLAAHRFIFPAVQPEGQDYNDENCFCGWAGPSHGQHLQDKVDEFVGPAKVDEEEKEEPKPAPRKAAAKKVEDKADKDDSE